MGKIIVVTVNGAPRTAPIEPPFCQPPPPVTCGNVTARYGLVLSVSGVVPASRRFCALRLPPHASHAIYISPAPLPRTTTHFLFPFSPWLSASAGALPPSQRSCATRAFLSYGMAPCVSPLSPTSSATPSRPGILEGCWPAVISLVSSYFRSLIRASSCLWLSVAS